MTAITQEFGYPLYIYILKEIWVQYSSMTFIRKNTQTNMLQSILEVNTYYVWPNLPSGSLISTALHNFRRPHARPHCNTNFRALFSFWLVQCVCIVTYVCWWIKQPRSDGLFTRKLHGTLTSLPTPAWRSINNVSKLHRTLTSPPTPPHPNVQRSISNMMKPQQRDQVHMNVIAPPHPTPMCSVAWATSWSFKTL